MLRNALSGDSTCLDWLMSGIAGGLLSEFNKLFGALEGASGLAPLAGAADLGPPATDGNGEYSTSLGTGFLVNVNTQGAFFTAAASVGYATDSVITSIQSASPRAQAFILLREIAHYFQAPGFIGPDNTVGRQTFNNNLIGQECSKTIQAFSNSNASSANM